MHSPYASNKSPSNEFSSLCFGFCLVCGFHVGMCDVGLCLCAVVCMALTVQEHRGHTPVHSVLLHLVSPPESVAY